MPPGAPCSLLEPYLYPTGDPGARCIAKDSSEFCPVTLDGRREQAVKWFMGTAFMGSELDKAHRQS